MSFTFIDLFAGIGGFHAALEALGGECVYANEIDPFAASVYNNNWGIDPLGDITVDVTEKRVKPGAHDVLVAGFPCQPFSKSGAQLGMEETRGTLYWNILRIIEKRKPKLVILENVRNLTGPRHEHEWNVIINTLRNAGPGYIVSEIPAIFSPHLLPPDLGGRPQVRERVFIVAVRKKRRNDPTPDLVTPVVSNLPINNWNPQDWNLVKHLPLDKRKSLQKYRLSDEEEYWVDAWNDFVVQMRKAHKSEKLPGFPIWGDSWVSLDKLKIPKGTPVWKRNFLEKNSMLYTENKSLIDKWVKKWDFYSEKFPPSRRKLEWQAQDTENLWGTVMHFRPSGIRAKKPTYVPALVAITQTSIIGPMKRRLSPREAARMQGIPDWFDFGGQTDARTYKQLGNGVSIGAVWHVIRSAVIQHSDVFSSTCPELLEAVTNSPNNPDLALKALGEKHLTRKSSTS